MPQLEKEGEKRGGGANFHTPKGGTNLEAKSSRKLHKLNWGPSKLRFQQTYSRTERLRNTNPTTPNSTQSELKWVQIKDPKHVWKVRTIIWITKQFQNVTCLYSNRAARRDESNKPKIIKFRYQSDVLLKVRRSAQSQTLCSRPDALLKARRSAQGQTLYSRPDILLRARRFAQGQTLCSRPDILLKARRSAQGLTFLLKARHSAEPPPDAGVLLDY
ncbi:hypothetical protein M5K25_025809 [Dendrobium thyrsiflorum]|uniref:Uncharacterized protein n=1 Tax=Dendrobium thyrsiflorum TaxID=117978 RepID=A0ABD0UAA3_DENTH